jgi:hypothetical protein
MKRVVFVLAFAACNTPAPSLRLALAGPPSQACPSTDCAQVPMNCKAVMSIRIVDPLDPTSPYLSQCVDVPTNRNQDMCAIASVDLESTALPVRDLEVQVALYPLSVIQPDPMNPELVCPTRVSYSAATGFPVEQSPAPALGGRAFYHPGDEKVIVTLGCTDLAAINESCIDSNPVTVVATVDDFLTRFSVPGGSPSLADGLRVSVGEPSKQADGTFVLSARDLLPLERASEGPIPTWGGNIDHPFQAYACLEVLEAGVERTATVRCEAATASDQLDLGGVYLEKMELDSIVGALGLGGVPDEGLTMGIVVNASGRPVENVVVSASTGTVSYLVEQPGTPDMFVTGATSATGVFVSRDAPFGTAFSAVVAGQPIQGIGGLVEGRVTIVILRPGGSAP